MSYEDNCDALGVVVGNFQTPELSKSHRSAIEAAISCHSKALVCIIASQALVTKKKPLDFAARKEMILAEYPNIEITETPDSRYDNELSVSLDLCIRKYASNGAAIIYGVEEDVTKRYSGKFPVNKLAQTAKLDPEIANAKKQARSSADFRAGMIYAVARQYPKIYPTVDIAVLIDDSALLARKPKEQLFRFIGGFVDPTDASYEDAARREVKEETGIEIEYPKYIGSARLDDWRYQGEEDKIITLFFAAHYRSGAIAPQDDIEETRIVKLADFAPDMLVPEHRALYDMLNASLKFR